MLIATGTIVRDTSDTELLSTPTREICWRGFVYKGGFKAGADSLRELAEVREEDVPRVAAQLKGAYFVALRCKDSGNAYAFIDPNGMYHAYCSPRAVGTSFLQIVRHEALSSDDFDPETVVEFLQFGLLHEDRTFFGPIRKIKPNVVLRCNATGPAESLPKPVPDISEPPSRSFDSLMQDFATASKDESVSVDITGGADSRLVATALAYFGLPFEMATSGRPGIPDIEIGARVAQTLGRPFYPTYHSAKRTNWDRLFSLTEGMLDISKVSRSMQLLEDRKSRGVTLSVSGVCGELFREVWWMQDFPFYARRKPRLDRLFALRIAAIPFNHSLLGSRYRGISKTYPQKMLRRIRHFAVPSNRKTYDRVYYYFHLPSLGGSVVTAGTNLVKIGMPYVDHEMIRIGYNLPPLQRVFNRYHRKAMHQFSQTAARLPTTEAGVSLSAGFLPITADLGKHLHDRSKRLAKKIGQQVLGRTFFQDSADDVKLIEELRLTVAKRKSTEILADCAVLNRAFAADELSPRYLGRILVLGQLFQRLDRTGHLQQYPKAIQPVPRIFGRSL